MDIEERDFFQDRFTEAELRRLSQGMALSDLFARRSPSLKQLGLADQELSEERMLELMLQEPRLVRRPLLKIGERLVVGGSVKAVEEALAGG